MRRVLSSQATAVLETLSQQPSDRMEIRQLVELLRPGHGSAASTRASLSRTLRRLWRDGLVELSSWGRGTLTERYAALDTALAEHEADPEAAYADVLAAIDRGVPGFFPYDSPAKYLDYKRWAVLDIGSKSFTNAASAHSHRPEADPRYRRRSSFVVQRLNDASRPRYRLKKFHQRGLCAQPPAGS